MRTPIAPGIYHDADRNCYLVRPRLSSGWTFRKLAAVSRRAAIIEGTEKLAMHRRYREGLESRSPFEAQSSLLFNEAADLYIADGCSSGSARIASFITTETRRLKFITRILRKPIGSITLSTLLEYRDKRVKEVRTDGLRTVELEWVTISNVLSWACLRGLLPANPVKHGRPKLLARDKVRHCRDVSISTGDQLHAMAGLLFDDPRSEVFGWIVLFAGMFGLRRSELLRLRMDASNPSEPGFVEGSHLFLRRSKGGLNPWFELTATHRDLLHAHTAWHAGRSPWYFFGRDERFAATRSAVTTAVRRAASALGYGVVTPHGLRSFYVTKRRGDGASDLQIAAEIGDSSWSLLASVYGNAPANWTGRPRPSFTPDGDPAWVRLGTVHRLYTEEPTIVPMSLDEPEHKEVAESDVGTRS